MPTSLTQLVNDGEITDLNGFAWLCARQFGALITMRDAPLDAQIKIPEKYEEDENDYSHKELVKAKEQLAVLESETFDETMAQAAADKAREEVQKRQETLDAEKRRTRERYQAMLAKVKAWNPPEQLERLKALMIEQLTDSIDHDCSSFNLDGQEPVKGSVWKEREIQRLRNSIERLEQYIEDERDRVEERLKWLHALQDEVGPPPVKS